MGSTPTSPIKFDLREMLPWGGIYPDKGETPWHEVPPNRKRMEKIQQPVNDPEQTQEKLQEGMLELGQKIIDEANKLEIKENDRNERGELLVSPDGPVSNLGRQNELYWKMVRTNAFKTFFGDWQNNPESASKITDSNGEPLVVFRGYSPQSGQERKTFNPYDHFYTKGLRDTYTLGDGIYFTPDPKIAAVYARPRGTICSAFVNVSRPKYTTLSSETIREIREIFYVLIPKKLQQKLQQFIQDISLGKGEYDGVLGKRRDLLSTLTKNPEELYELMVMNTQQMLIIPAPIEKTKKPIVNVDWVPRRNG